MNGKTVRVVANTDCGEKVRYTMTCVYEAEARKVVPKATGFASV